MGKRKNTQYRWFIKSGDNITNKRIAKMLEEKSLLTESRCVLVDNNDKVHNVWEIPYSFISLIQNSRKDVPFKFKVFNREGDYGTVRECKFPLKRKSKTVKETVRSVKKSINKIKKDLN